MAVVQSHGPTASPLIRCGNADRNGAIIVIPTGPDGHTQPISTGSLPVTLINSPRGGNARNIS